MRGRLTVALLLLATPAAAADYVNDPLTAATFTGRGSNGGTFGPSGWTTVNEPDAIWYEIADAIPTGSIEYTVTGLSMPGSLSGTDHDILTFYQAPTGKPEPVPYSPYFRNNDFKAFTRIFGEKEPGRGGAMKLELAFCPRGDPWYHDTPCTPDCDKSGIAYARGTDKDVGWDGTKAYRMVMAWEPGKISFSRDGETLGTISFAGTYAAKPLRVRFGSPRHDGVYPGEAFMPKGLVFKDVKITGTPGSMTSVCGATMPDASVPDTSVSDAAVPAGELGALQDVTAASYEMGVFSDVNDLNPESGNAVAYLKFPPITGVPSNVKLRLHTHDFPSASGGSGVVCLVDDDKWSETTLTWATRPMVSSTCAGVSKKVDPDTEVEWDVTSLFTTSSTANRNLAIVSMDADGVHYVSKEKDKARGPRLVVTGGTVTMPDSGTPDTATPGDSSVITDSGTVPTSDARGNDSDREGDDLEGSCGCRTAGAPTTGWGALFGLIALRTLLRRRRSGS
jgi:MYXO-CTERM domain-containing protein